MDRPNVLFITADQHRFDVAGFAGNAHAHTPNLDRLAGEGARITEVYCQSPLCVPARQTLVTGRYAHDHGSFANWLAFAPEEWTVARALAAAGYDTAFFGKTHADTAGFRTVVDRNEMVRAFRADHADAVVPGKIHRRGPQARKSFKLHQMNPGTLPPGDDSVSVFHMDEPSWAGPRRSSRAATARRRSSSGRASSPRICPSIRPKSGSLDSGMLGCRSTRRSRRKRPRDSRRASASTAPSSDSRP